MEITTEIIEQDTNQMWTISAVYAPDFNGDPVATVLFNGFPIAAVTSGDWEWIMPIGIEGAITHARDCTILFAFMVGALSEDDVDFWQSEMSEFTFNDAMSHTDEHAIPDFFERIIEKLQP